MPLKAIVEGGTFIGPDLSEEEWADLKLRHKSGCVVVGPAGVSRREDPASRGTPAPVRGSPGRGSPGTPDIFPFKGRLQAFLREYQALF